MRKLNAMLTTLVCYWSVTGETPRTFNIFVAPHGADVTAIGAADIIYAGSGNASNDQYMRKVA